MTLSASFRAVAGIAVAAGLCAVLLAFATTRVVASEAAPQPTTTAAAATKATATFAAAAAASDAASATAAVAAPKVAIAFPEGYRRWTHVKSMIVEPGHPLAGLVEGTHHIYANEAALRAYRGKRPFADGAVIVFDLLNTVRGDLAVTEGPRKAVIVMQKDSRRFAATDGWSYQVFGGPAQREPQLDASAAAGCHGCHTSQAGRDFVFSDWRE
jgi:hypothetical protein